MKKIQLTNAHKEKLFQIPLFRDLPLNIKESLLDKLDFVIYAADKKEIVVTQGTPCNKLYVLLEGKLRTDIIDGLGNEVMIEYIILCHPSPFQFKQYVASYFYCFGRQRGTHGNQRFHF